MPIPFAAAKRRAAKRCCIRGSPPLSVNPPAITLSPERYFRSSSAAREMVTGIPLPMAHVSGLWQYRQRHMQPAVHATTRTPGPSTVAPVVNECRNPTSPLASAVRMSDSGTCLPRPTRSSNGLAASSGVVDTASFSGMAASSVERPVDDVHLLFSREPHEVDGIARDANRQARILLRVLDRIEQGLAIQHVHVHVIAGAPEERVEHAGEIVD